jgi:predicted SAM-dependent methyltransferase
MRNCPICDSDKRLLLWRSEFLVPTGWKRPKYLDWFKCQCGMIYGDNPTITQQDYDWYYVNKYGYGVVDEANKKRLYDRAVYIADRFEENATIVDFGGGESGLVEVLKSMDFFDAVNFGCGDVMPENVDVIIAEHVLEHIYDMNDAMFKIDKSLKPGGMLIVDIPDATSMALERPFEMPILDFTQVHINHFRMIDLLKLAEKWGFELQETTEYHERHGGCRMFVFVKDLSVVGRQSQWFTIRNIAGRCEKLKQLRGEPVCVWGCGDLALHCLAKQFPNVQYFVDSDPAYRGETIYGLPVYLEPIDDLPIVVIAQGQKNSILENIKRLGLTNKVIII